MSSFKTSYGILFVIVSTALLFVSCGEDLEQNNGATSIRAQFNFAPSRRTVQEPGRIMIAIEADDMDRIEREFPLEGEPPVAIVEDVPIGPNRLVRVEVWIGDRLLAIGEDHFNLEAQEVNSFAIQLELVYPELPKACVGYWGFNEREGDIALDLTGRGNDGQIIGNTQRAPGRFGPALEFHGDDQVVVRHHESLHLSEALTIMAWVVPMSPEGSIVSKGKAYGLGLIDEKIVWLQKPLVDETVPLQEWIHTEFAEIPLHDWVHIAFVFDYGRGEQRLYLNGELARVRPTKSRLPLSNGDIIMGGFTGRPAFDGVLDELSLWNRALTEPEIREIIDWAQF